jgi:hypothetical protein
LASSAKKEGGAAESLRVVVFLLFFFIIALLLFFLLGTLGVPLRKRVIKLWKLAVGIGGKAKMNLISMMSQRFSLVSVAIVLHMLKMLLSTLFIMEPRCRRGGVGEERAAGKSSWRGAALEEPT